MLINGIQPQPYARLHHPRAYTLDLDLLALGKETNITTTTKFNKTGWLLQGIAN